MAYKKNDYFEKQKDAIIKFCLFRDRCKSEVSQKLQATKLKQREIKSLLKDLDSVGLLDESKFANSFVKGKFKYNKWGRNRIIYNLRIKNIPQDIISTAIKEIKEQDYIITIKELIKLKSKTLDKNDPKKTKKIYNYLIQKGYEIDIIRKELESKPISNHQ